MNTFETCDIVLAATLKINNFQLYEITKTGNRGTFCFENIPTDFITKFDTGNCLVEPVAFNNAIKTLTTSVRR